MGKIIRTIIIDDEPNSREILDRLLALDGDIAVLAKCGNITDGMEAIETHEPDLIFLDIEMPDGSGFDLLDKLRKTSYDPIVVFVTAYNHFAIKAFKYAAFDYLLKPVDIDDLTDTLARYKKDMESSRISYKADMLLNQFPQFRKLRFSTRSGIMFVEPTELIWCEASGSYSILHLFARKDEIISIPLKDIEILMAGMPFFRVSRSAIINLDYLVRIDKRRRICVVQREETIFEIPVSASSIKHLEEM